MDYTEGTTLKFTAYFLKPEKKDASAVGGVLNQDSNDVNTET